MGDEDNHNQKQLFYSCIDALESCLDYVGKYSEEDNHIQTNYIKTVLAKNYCDIDLSLQNSMSALQKTQETFTNPKENAKMVFERLLEKVQDKQIRSHPVWLRINNVGQDSIVEVNKDDEDNEEEREYETLDDSMMCSQSKALPLDPLTKMAIKNPCKNKKCGHIYEYNTIMGYLKSKNKVRRCPYMGCGNVKMLVSQIVQEEELTKKVL